MGRKENVDLTLSSSNRMSSCEYGSDNRKSFIFTPIFQKLKEGLCFHAVGSFCRNLSDCPQQVPEFPLICCPWCISFFVVKSRCLEYPKTQECPEGCPAKCVCRITGKLLPGSRFSVWVDYIVLSRRRELPEYFTPLLQKGAVSTVSQIA